MKRRPPKQPDLLQAIRAAIGKDAYSFTDHALQRLLEREVTQKELLDVLKNGWHEAAKDRFLEEFQLWSYAIRGKTLEGRQLRAAVAFDPALLIITVIDLDV